MQPDGSKKHLETTALSFKNNYAMLSYAIDMPKEDFTGIHCLPCWMIGCAFYSKPILSNRPGVRGEFMGNCISGRVQIAMVLEEYALVAHKVDSPSKRRCGEGCAVAMWARTPAIKDDRPPSDDTDVLLSYVTHVGIGTFPQIRIRR